MGIITVIVILTLGVAAKNLIAHQLQDSAAIEQAKAARLPR